MSTLHAVLWPTERETRVLLEQQGRLLLKARLAPLCQSHPAALGRLLEALSLWQTTSLIAVLGVDARAPTWSSTDSQPVTDRVTLERCTIGRSAALSDLRHAASEIQRRLAREARHAG